MSATAVERVVMALGPAALMAACEEAVRTYNPVKTTVDTHTADYIAEKKIGDADDQRFIEQVMYGCMRYKKMLKVFLSSLYFKHGGETQRADYTLYMVLSYIALLRLHELGFSSFRALLLTQENFKMSVLLKFLFSEENLTQWLRPEWLKLYDPAFVDEQLIGKALVFVGQAQQLKAVLEGNAAKAAAAKEAAAEAARALSEGRGGTGVHTTPEPFNLTQPKIRLVPPPEDVIETTFKANKVPASTYLDPKELVDRIEIDKAKDVNRLKMKAKYSDPRVQPFKLRVLERPSNLDKVRAEVEAVREAECDFEGANLERREVPKQVAGQGAVKLNAAAILREDNLYRKKQEKEAKLLGAYESELRDTSEFDAWQLKMRALDEEQRLAEVERRRMETLLADEEARESKARRLRENKALAVSAKAEASANELKRQQEIEHRRVHQRSLVMDVQSQRERPAIAAEEVLKHNRARAQELREQTERLEQQAAEERKVEEARRADLIKQIRALELVPRQRITALDPTYTPKIGLLEEMSLAELRERLRMDEEARQEEEEEKRAQIITAKQEREADLAKRVERLTAMREMSAQQAADRRRKTKEAERQAEAEKRERVADAQLKLHATLEEKREKRRQEDKALAAELKAIRIKNQFLGADKEAVERKKWESQQSGAQREIAQRQYAKQDDALKAAALVEKETRQRLSNLQREREEHEAFLREYERRCTEAQFDAHAAADAVKASRLVNFDDEQARRAAAAVIRDDSLPYAVTITKANKAQAQQDAARRSRRSEMASTKGFEYGVGSLSASRLTATADSSRAADETRLGSAPGLR